MRLEPTLTKLFLQLETEVGTDLKIDGRNMLENYTLDLGSAIAPFCSFINHSCCPNVATMITEKGEIILYAVQSIEENEQVSTFVLIHK